MSDSRDPSDIPFPDDELPPENPAETHAREPGSDDDTPLPDEVSFYRLPSGGDDDLREDTREEIPADLTDDRPISQRAAVSGRHALQFAILQQHIRIMERLVGCAAAFQFILYP